MEAVANLHFLQFAEMRVEGPQRGASGVADEAEVAIETVALGGGDDLVFEPVATALVDAGGEIVFVDQGFEFGQRPVDFGAGHRRHQVVDDDGAGAALGLRALAGIVDDERVDQRRRPERDLRPAGPRQAERLARQPFEIAVLADMDDRVGAEALAEPRVEGEIVVRRHEVGVVIGRLGIDVVAARRLDADDDIAEAMDGEMEDAVREMRVVLGRSPALGERLRAPPRGARRRRRGSRRSAGRRGRRTAALDGRAVRSSSPDSSSAIRSRPVSGKPGSA